MWAIEHYGTAPDLVVAGKSLGGGLPLASVTGPARIMDVVEPGGLGGTFSGNPVSCAAAVAVLRVVAAPEFQELADELETQTRARLEPLAARFAEVGEIRGLGPMIAIELVERTATLANAIVNAAFDRGLLLLSCGLHGNVIRLLPPITITPDELDRGLGLLEEALAHACE